MTDETESHEVPPVVRIIDDDASVRAAVEDLLASVGLEARSYPSTQAFLDSDEPEAPGCLVLDVRMPGQSGLDFQREMTGLGIGLPVIFITGHGDVPMSVRAMKDGAVEFLTKPFDDQALLDAIHDGIGRDRLRRAFECEIAALLARYSTLNAGERAVMALVVKGLLNKQVAGFLEVSEITVKVRRRQVMLKMGATSLPQLVRMYDSIAAQIEDVPALEDAPVR
ncbi:response regulator transcription factor [Novosphingobium sp. Leaf2]|uniref:response regulator transcription factor n=1 Tax=Novosphingobium sp. Leaf2 TaxID=1735670 RepID=UPI0006FBA2B1|nr:response regulator [Novosphingobium sp. Leaf2]KQM19661.1 two-component system response regulator [Novosphingobium sp. Leaf2]